MRLDEEEIKESMRRGEGFTLVSLVSIQAFNRPLMVLYWFVERMVLQLKKIGRNRCFPRTNRLGINVGRLGLAVTLAGVIGRASCRERVYVLV